MPGSVLKVDAHRVGAGFKPDVGNVNHCIHLVAPTAGAFVEKVKNRLRRRALTESRVGSDHHSFFTVSLKAEGVELFALRQHVNSRVDCESAQAVEHLLDILRGGVAP